VADDTAITLRRAQPDDADEIGEVHVRAWQVGYRGLMPAEFLDGLSSGQRSQWWRRSLTEGDPTFGVTKVAVRGGRVVGFASYGEARAQPAADPSGASHVSHDDRDSHPTGELYALNVHPDHWRTGAGMALIVDTHSALAASGHWRTGADPDRGPAYEPVLSSSYSRPWEPAPVS
jgi:GNAT superfamily N-acetyltransferase